MSNIRQIPQRISSRLVDLGTQGVLVSILVLIIVALFLIPLPRRVLDILLVINIVIALLLLVRGLFISDPVRLFSFPTILLFTTLYRLALNVSSTRLILLNGDQGLDAAGHVIESFGKFVVQSDFIVGAIIFAIIAIVNFMVIAKGSARVAEVAARFTLDALPGKQLSIDSDLRAGNISKEQAARRREDLNREAQFFGAMDGAMKFVQGDAIAGFIITFINAVGGVALGVGRPPPRQLSFSEAVDTFGILTIGDGLVSILPSLLISVCAGTIVTHVAGRSRRGTSGEIFTQIVSEPKAIVISAISLLIVGLIPAFPFWPFFIVGALLLLVAWRGGMGAEPAISKLEHAAETDRLTSSDALVEVVSPKALSWSGEEIETVVRTPSYLMSEERLSSVQALRVELSPFLLKPGRIELEEFYEVFGLLRREVYRDRGVVLPNVSVAATEHIERSGYRVLVREQVVKSGVIDPQLVFVEEGRQALVILGVDSVREESHPIDCRACVWVSRSASGLRAIEHLGFNVILPHEYLAKCVVGSALDVVDEIFGLNEIKAVLERTKEQHAQLVEEIFDKELLTYSEFAEVIRRLTRECVNVRDLKLILEGVAEFSSLGFDVKDRQEWLSELHAFLRVVLSRTIVRDCLGPGDKLRLFVVSSDIEDEFRSASSLWDHSRSRPPLEPEFEASLRSRTSEMFRPVLERGTLPVVLLCSQDVRPAIQDFLSRHLSSTAWFRTMAYQELDGRHQPESVGVLSIGS